MVFLEWKFHSMQSMKVPYECSKLLFKIPSQIFFVRSLLLSFSQPPAQASKLYWDIKWLLHQKQIKEQFSWYNRAIYDWVSKVIWDSLVFALLRFMIGPENSRNSLDQ